VPNFVQICAIVNELWAIDEIQNGGRRHLEFIIFVHFGQTVYFRWQPSTSLQNFIHLRQSAAELLMFVQKSKMAAAAILNYNFVMLDHPRSSFMHETPLKISCWSSAYFSRYRDSKISQIWLKMPIQAPKNHVFGEFWPPNIIFYHRDPQKGIPYAETRVLSHKGLVWPVDVGKNTKKDRTKSNGKCPP